MDQTLTGNATIASGERILQHGPATGTPEERFEVAMTKSLANAAKEREEIASRPLQAKTQVKVTVMMEFDCPVDPAEVGEAVISTLDMEYSAGYKAPHPTKLVELLSAEVQPCPTENT